MVAIAFGVLVTTAAIATGLARSTATSAARDSVRADAPVVASEFETLFRQVRRQRLAGVDSLALNQRVRQLVTTLLEVSHGGIVGVDANGEVEEILGRLLETGTSEPVLPNPVRPGDLDTERLLAGRTQVGQRGDDVFAAVPLAPVLGITPVVVLAEHVETRPFGDSGRVVLAAAIGAMLVAALVAAYLARRLTTPLAAMQTTADTIAGGDFSARVDTRRVPDDELGSLATTINRMASELEAARRHERSFLLSVSHDLRTPLTSIRGYAEALADGMLADTDAQARAAGVITSEARRLERLVADLLDLARLDAHEFTLTPRPTDARRVVGDTTEAFLPAAAELGLELQLAPGGPVAADVDPERLAQIVANLVENALKYASSRVTVAVTSSGHLARVQVDDDGPGIDPADLPHVFDRLYTARAVPGRKLGTGIGLAIVRELAAAMGGSATVEPLDGPGTRFVVTVPLGAGA